MKKHILFSLTGGLVAFAFALSLSLSLSLSGCVSQPTENAPSEPAPGGVPPYIGKDHNADLHSFNLVDLQMQMGLGRRPQELGFDERPFDGCRWGQSGPDGKCGPMFLSVIHFRLLCRDSVETVQEAAVNLTPLGGGELEWRIAGSIGRVTTDAAGYGQVLVASPRSAKSQRFILILGKKSLGVEAGEVTQIVIPGNWCAGMESRAVPPRDLSPPRQPAGVGAPSPYDYIDLNKDE